MILVNGASSSGMTTFCRALQERLTQRADGNHAAAFARVAFDDVVLLMSERLYPISADAIGTDRQHGMGIEELANACDSPERPSHGPVPH